MHPRTPPPTEDLALPAMVCFRVTRRCNARCGFCLAPPDGAHPDAAELCSRIDWLRAHGVRTIHFCGGEPTIRPDLAQLVAHARALGLKSRLTTNGILLPEELLVELGRARTEVKLSLHGDARRHDELVGREAFDAATGTLRRLLAARVPTSVQTTVVHGGSEVVGWMAAFCLREGVRRLSILPFIPRGSGRERAGDFGLAQAERHALRELVARTRRELGGRLDVRWLDFSTRDFHVVEADGRLVLERSTEALDQVLLRLPAPAVS